MDIHHDLARLGRGARKVVQLEARRRPERDQTRSPHARALKSRSLGVPSV
jgi:hypothetical protein